MANMEQPFTGKADKAQKLRELATKGAARVLHLANVEARDDKSLGLDHFRDKYGTAAQDFFWALHGYDERFAHTSAPLGFAEMTRILGYAPDAYMRFCRAKNTTPTIAELKEILGRSYMAADMFMALSNSKYKTFKTNFGLGNKDYADPSCTFEVMKNDNGELVYMPDPDGWHLCQEELTFLRKEPEREQLEGCAARGRFGEDVWASGIELFCTDPKYFQADLEELKMAA